MTSHSPHRAILARLTLLPVLALAALAASGAGCKSNAKNPDDGVDPDAAYDGTIPDPDARGTSTLMLAGGFTATYACTTSSSFDTAGKWTLAIAPMDSGSATFALSVKTTGAAPTAGTYTFDSANIDADTFVGLTVFGETLRSWNAQKGDGTVPRAGSLTLELTDPGTTSPTGPEATPHGSVTATLVSDSAAQADVSVTGTF